MGVFKREQGEQQPQQQEQGQQEQEQEQQDQVQEQAEDNPADLNAQQLKQAEDAEKAKAEARQAGTNV